MPIHLCMLKVCLLSRYLYKNCTFQIPGQPGQTMQLLSAANLQPRTQLNSPAQGSPQSVTGQAKINAQGGTGAGEFHSLIQTFI